MPRSPVLTYAVILCCAVEVPHWASELDFDSLARSPLLIIVG